MVKDKDLLKSISFRILVFSDPNFFSLAEYCRKFCENVVEGQRLYDYYISVHAYESSLLLFHYSELNRKVIVIDDSSDTFNYPSESQFSVKQAKNVLTYTDTSGIRLV